MTAPAPDSDQRVLLLTPTRRDAATAVALLGDAGIATLACERVADALPHLEQGAAALVVPEEMLTPHWRAELARRLAVQPTWSDLPVLVLTHAGADSPTARAAVQTLGNVTLLERPLRVATLVSAVISATRARQRQYQIRGHLEERQRAEAALREADRRKDEFLATLGHELRNPLAPLVSGVRLLQMAQLREPQAVQVVQMMDRQLTHMVRLVDDLLEVSRITRGLVEVRHDHVDLIRVLQDAIDGSRETIHAASHELTVDLPAAALPVRGDVVRLTQVFTNLLVNAAKYTNAGGHISLRAEQCGGRVRVAVRDDGIGLAPDHKADIFDMFVQVDRSARRSQGGLGIGLTLVRSLVVLHGGHVEAHSAGLGQGSEFVVDLPLDVSVTAPAPPGGQAPRQLAGKRILIVDDNRDAADTLAALLTLLGADVAVAYDGSAALAEANAFEPHTILLDLGMPGMDGYEVARRLRGDRHRGTHLVALTGWGQDEDHRLSRDAGFDDHLVKPPDLGRLTALVSAR